MRCWPLALLIACRSPVLAPLDLLAGQWCPVDSLTQYSYTTPHDSITYVPGEATNSYHMDLDGRGLATADGTYTGRFTQRDSIGVMHTSQQAFTLPVARGIYDLREVTIVFTFPYPDAGPTWFWEIARHEWDPADITGWQTVVDWTGAGAREHLLLGWHRCG